MRRLIQSLPNLEVLAIHTASAIIDVTNEETIQKWDVILDIVKYVSGCNKLRWLRFDVMDQLSFIPFLKKFGVSNLGTTFSCGCCFEVLKNWQIGISLGYDFLFKAIVGRCGFFFVNLNSRKILT